MKKKIWMLCVLVLTLAMVSGCQSKQEASAADKMITVKDAKGEVAIPADPKRIVDLSGNSDILSLLGIFRYWYGELRCLRLYQVSILSSGNITGCENSWLQYAGFYGY